MFWFKGLLIHQISLQLGVLNVKDFIVKLLEFSIGHLVAEHCQVISQHNLQLFGTYVPATVLDLPPVSIDVNWFLTILMTELTEDLRHYIAFIVIHVIFSFLWLIPFDRRLSLHLTSLRIQPSMVFGVLSSLVAYKELDLRKCS